MNKISRRLDKLSGYLFFVAFLTARLKAIPIGIVTTVFHFFSLATYLIGYIAWYIAALCYPHYRRTQNKWYGFFEFKDQYQLSALIGLAATILCLAFPALIFPTALLYTISNTIWCISEYHKINNPYPLDHHYSKARQRDYLRYTVLVTISSAIVAIGALLALCFPPLTTSVILAAALVSGVITLISLYYWGKSGLKKYSPDKPVHSYTQVAQHLDASLEHSNHLNLDQNPQSLAPVQSTRLFQGSRQDQFTDNDKESLLHEYPSFTAPPSSP